VSSSSKWIEKGALHSKVAWFAPLAQGSDQFNVSTSFYDPGPGTYNLDVSTYSMKPNITHGPMVVQPSKDAPSIPSKRFPPYEHSGRPEDRVGPNEYEPNK